MMKKTLLALVTVFTMFAFTACTPTIDSAVDKVVATSKKVEKIANEGGSQADFDKAVKEYEEALKNLDKFDKKELSAAQLEEIAASGARVATAEVKNFLPF